MPGKIKFLLIAVCLFSTALTKAQPWTRITALPQKSYWSLKVIGTTMYAGSTDTLYISKDKGVTWSAKKIPGSGYAVNAVTMYQGRLFAGTDNGSFMSSDGGANWAPSNIHIKITSFAQWKGDLYASTSGAGIFICSQVGNAWMPFNQNFPAGTAGLVPRVINTGNTLFAVGGSNGSGFRYDTTAHQWTERFYTGAALPGMIAFDLMQGGGSLFALNNTTKMMRSEDTGTSWTVDSTDMRGGTDGVVLKASLLYYVAWNLGGTGTWLQSRDVNAPAGTSWATGEELLSAGTVYSMREHDRRLFIAKNDGVYYKANGSPSAGVKPGGAAKSVLIYPNPSQGAVTIKAEGIDKLEVWDISGRLVHRAISPASVYQLRLPSAGTYVVRLIAGEEVISRNVIVY